MQVADTESWFQAKEKYVLWYVLLGSVVVLIVTIFSGIYMFEHGAILLLFVLSRKVGELCGFLLMRRF